jgi:Holliday junction resolvase
VREKAPSEIVENYAIEYVKNKLQEQGYFDVRPGHNGHDLICSKDEVEYYIEVKGRTTDIDDIKLERSEVKTAIKKKNNYILAVVFGIPNQPKLCKVINPVEAIEDWYEITIPKETLKKFCS